MDEANAKYINILHIPPKPIIKLIEKVNKIFVLCLAIAIGYAAFCVMPENSIGTYISEKALMAGLVNEGFNPTIYGYKNRDQITEQLRSQSNNNNRSSLISTLLEDMGYRAYLQNFNYTKEGRNKKSQNVYSIIKCQRGPGTESIIVVIPMTAKYIDSQVLALELFNFLNSMQNWSKNVIFLFTPNLMGTQAFLSSFYNQAHSKIQYDSLQFSSGDLIGGVVLNLVGKKFGKLNIQYNMINGRYPNLDWFNGVLRIGEKFDLSTMIHTPTLKNVIPTNTGELMYHGETCSRSVVAQAFSETENFHSLFGLHCVSVVTLQSDFKVSGHVSTRSMTRLVEATVRALNNLDERFHHSYQFYLLTGPRNFLSIAFYEPIIGIFCVPILIKALQEYYSTITGFNFPLSFLLTHLFAFTSYFITLKFEVDQLTSTILILSTFIPLIFLPFTKSSSCHRFIVCLLIPLSLGAISLLNFSFSLIFTSIYAPISFMVLSAPPQNKGNVFRVMKLIKIALAILIHPYIIYILIAHYEGKFDLTNVDLSNLAGPLTSLLHNHLFHYSFNFPLIMLSMVPLWQSIIFSI